MQKKGILITFEGPEGSGKSTHSKLLCDFLIKKRCRVLHTREPGGTPLGEKIRRVLLDPRNKDMDVTTEMLLYMAARASVVRKKILPAMKKYMVVVCDRFQDATLAYQGYAGGMDKEIINSLGKVVTQGLSPDITFLLDIDSEAGLRRAGKTKDRMEMKPLGFHKKVREGYLDIAKKEPRRVKVVSALGEINETQDKIRKILLKLINC